jgi:type IV secretion system protein TrbL
LAGAFSKILLIGAFAYIINDWQGLSETIFAGFMRIGLQAGGGGIGAGDFFNPGAIIETGWEIVKAIGDAPTVTEDPLDVIGNLVDAIIIGISMLGIMIAFAILALQIIVTLLEFKIVTLGGFILLPFGIFSKTAFMAERPLGYVVAAGLKCLALAIIVSGAQTVFAQLIPSPEPDIYEALTILTAAVILAMLSIFAPNLAAALVSGGPALGVGALTVGGLAVGAAGGAAIGATMAAGSAMAGGVSRIASASKAAAGASAGKPPSGGGGGPSGAAGSDGGGPRGPSGGGSGGGHGPSGASATAGQSGSTGHTGRSSGGMAGAAQTGPAQAQLSGKSGKAEHSAPHGPRSATPTSGLAHASAANAASTAEPQSGEPSGGAGPSVAAAGAASPNASGPASGPGQAQRYHRFPERSAAQTATRARAFNAFWTANAARQLMPANENAGALNPSIREED